MASLCEERVDAALRQAAIEVVYEGDRRWKFGVADGMLVSSRLHVSGDWLRCTTELPGWVGRSAPADCVAWLRINAGLDGGVRVAVMPWTPTPQLVADACSDAGTDLRAQLRTMCLELIDAVHFVDDWTGDDLPLDAPGDPVPTADIERACIDAGWTRTSGAGITVRLGTHPRVTALTATLSTSASGIPIARVPLADVTAWPATCRHAVAALLMRASGSVRTVKGALCTATGADLATFVSPVTGSLDRGVDRALSALAVACRMSSQEVLALQDERVAASYLAALDESYEHQSSPPMEEHSCLQQL
jgi:hypothetical protein